MIASAQSSIATIDQFISAVGRTKQAEDGKPLSEAGSKGGETTQPVKNVDDGLIVAKEGARSAENTADVKKQEGPASIDSRPEAKTASVFDLVGRFAKRAEGALSTPGSAEADAMNVGLKSAPTGEDPATETERAKAGKNDPGSTHPARTDNKELDGHKWAMDASMPLEKMAAVMKDLCDTLCAEITHYSNEQTKYAAASPSAASAPRQAIDPYLAQQAGWEMAGLLNGTFDKRAADAMVQQTLYEIIKQAADDADNYVLFAQSYQKAAEGPPPEMPPGGEGGGPPPGAGGPPPGGGGGGDEAMMAALGGGGGGAPPPGAGGPPGAEGGGAPPQAEEVLKMLEQLGVTPEQLMQALQEEEAGGGGGGPPPGAGGPPPGAGGPPPGAGGPPPGMEVQAADKQKQAADMAKYVSELITRSRMKTK